MSQIDAQISAWLESVKLLNRYQKLFLTGCPKSGTTWLVRALNGHPQIIANGEGRFAWRLIPFLQQAANAFNQDQKQAGGTDLGQITNDDFLILARAFSDRVLLKYLLTSGKNANLITTIADKTPQHVLSVPLLRLMYPQCRFINIVRDPRDAATSALFHLAKRETKSRDEYVESFITQSWKMHVEAAVNSEKQLGTDHFLNIRYEDFHADELGTITQCLRFIGADDSEESIQLCLEAGSFKKLSGGRERGQTDFNSFFRNGTIGDWKNHLPADLVNRCCQPVEGLMRHFGYDMEPRIEKTIYVQSTPKTAAA